MDTRGSELLVFIVAAMAVGCGSGESAPPGAGGNPGEVTKPACLDGAAPPPASPSDIGQFEPLDRVDYCNVTTVTGPPGLDLPPPPNSGFRVVFPPRVLGPGEEFVGCVALPYPEFQNKNVYAARLYTNGYLHHSNVTAVSYSAADSPSPYPDCNPGQEDPGSPARLIDLLKGNLTDVLFTNSSQVKGKEDLTFPSGMAYKLGTEGREIVAQVHWLNTTNDTHTSEIAYDFFTMPDDLVETEIVSFLYDNRAIDVPARSTREVTAKCNILGAPKIVSMLPHAHKRTTHFSIDLIDANGREERVLDDQSFDAESDRQLYNPPIDLTGFSKLRYTCNVVNDLDEQITWGFGDNEMCMIFGYMYPPSAQQVGYLQQGEASCSVVDFGRFRH